MQTTKYNSCLSVSLGWCCVLYFTCYRFWRIVHRHTGKKVKSKPRRSVGEVLISTLRPWARRWINTLVRRQTYGYLSSRRTSLPYNTWYLIILLGDTGTFVCAVSNLPTVAMERPWVELVIEWHASQRLNHYTTRPHNTISERQIDRQTFKIQPRKLQCHISCAARFRE